MFSRIVIWLGMADEIAFFNKLGLLAGFGSAFGERPNFGELASRGHSHSCLAIARQQFPSRTIEAETCI
jgi:hypothetical protein